MRKLIEGLNILSLLWHMSDPENGTIDGNNNVKLPAELNSGTIEKMANELLSEKSKHSTSFKDGIKRVPQKQQEHAQEYVQPAPQESKDYDRENQI